MKIPKPKRSKKNERQKLIIKIDKARREYVKSKYSDSSEKARCISCGVYGDVESFQVGHYYSRIHDFTTALGGCEENTQIQCVPCNYHKRGNPQGFGYSLVRNYGLRVLTKLKKAKETPKKWKISELQELLDKYLG